MSAAGAASLIIWTLISLALIKYATIVLRADDKGQGALSFRLTSVLV